MDELNGISCVKGLICGCSLFGIVNLWALLRIVVDWFSLSDTGSEKWYSVA